MADPVDGSTGLSILSQKDWTPSDRLDYLKRQEDANYGGQPAYDPISALLASTQYMNPLVQFAQRFAPKVPQATMQAGTPQAAPQFSVEMLKKRIQQILTRQRMR